MPEMLLLLSCPKNLETYLCRWNLSPVYTVLYNSLLYNHTNHKAQQCPVGGLRWPLCNPGFRARESNCLTCLTWKTELEEWVTHHLYTTVSVCPCMGATAFSSAREPMSSLLIFLGTTYLLYRHTRHNPVILLPQLLI